ncbi:hypothetical protein Sjap_004781 [Stephania japonica]|uniref:Uncharacterized protein n=1 Tax=Stephania japonica TaxID=461633 RepID=A0AAP0PHA8_9MAGN
MLTKRKGWLSVIPLMVFTPPPRPAKVKVSLALERCRGGRSGNRGASAPPPKSIGVQ